MKKIKLSWFLLPILTSPILANFISCSEQPKEESVTFAGSDLVDAQRTVDNELFIQYTDFSFSNFKYQASQILEVAAISTFSDNIESQIIYTQNNNFNVRIYIPNAENYEHGEYRISLIIYSRDESKSYFNQVLRFNVNPSIVVPREVPILCFEKVNGHYWTRCSGFTLRNFESPYNYGFRIGGASPELGNIKIEFEIEETNLEGDCFFSILFQSDAELIDPTKSYYIVLYVPNLDSEAMTFEVNGEKVGFEKDSWDTVCLYANEGFESLKRHYNLDSFIGLTREINLNGLKYHVRVIGENCDEISGVEGTYAPLTFQFCELISDSTGQAMKRRWTKNKTGYPMITYFNFWHHVVPMDPGAIITFTFDAEIRLYLNSRDNDGFLSLFPANIRGNLKKIKKATTFIDNFTEVMVADTSDDFVWLPSYSEICSPSELCEYAPYGYLNEGQCYEYYRKNKDQTFRVKTDLLGWTASYWTRTPEHYSTGTTNNNMVYKVGSNGVLDDVDMENENIGIAPCFAI